MQRVVYKIGTIATNFTVFIKTQIIIYKINCQQKR